MRSIRRLGTWRREPCALARGEAACHMGNMPGVRVSRAEGGVGGGGFDLNHPAATRSVPPGLRAPTPLAAIQSSRRSLAPSIYLHGRSPAGSAPPGHAEASQTVHNTLACTTRALATHGRVV
jgi:hypothetical protein